MFTKLEGQPNFDQLDLTVLQFWQDQGILDKSINQRAHDKTRTFYDGPITANGDPHYGHVLTFAMKDIIPRYWSMQGYRVARSVGWDCQGLPVEFEVEKNLGFKDKKDIETFGIARFNEECRNLVLKFRHNIVELENRIGRLTNADEEYATMDAKYIESVWWSLQELYNKGALYEGYKVVPYSTRAGTSLSNAEVALGGYKPFVDPAVTVKFELADEPGTYILGWTTTPWTLPTNFGLAVGQKIEYVKVSVDGSKYILAKDLAAKYFPDATKLDPVKAEDLMGLRYLPLFDFFADHPNSFRVLAGDHVTTDSGTGIVHLAPYGAEDVEIFKQAEIEVIDVLDEQGDFTAKVPPLAGQNYRVANKTIIEMLRTNGNLLNQEDYTHDMPMCWRTNTPLIYKPITSWYVGMSKLHEQLVANNEQVNWVPNHVKHGRFGNWLAEVKDWGISRSRYWGTPLPIWKSPSGKVKVIGSFAELQELSKQELPDPHRPFVDDIKFELDGETYSRVPDVIDVWYDSGAMPFARFHYPFENKEKFEAKFPAQYIAEGIDQTRGWFYSLIALSTALFNKTAFENVVINGTATDEKGAKLSKSKKNYSSPNEMLSKYGADAMRMMFFSSPISAGEDTALTDTTVRMQLQEFMLPLWNTFNYFLTYANIHSWTPRPELAQNPRQNPSSKWDHIPFGDLDNELDAWILAKLQNLIAESTARFESYDFPNIGRGYKKFLDDVSKWYIRRSRDRFVEGEERALSTLYYVLVEFSKLMAPITPFIAEHIYRTLAAEHLSELPESVHLCDFPVVDSKFLDDYGAILQEMDTTRTIAELGQSARTQSGIKVRQPLQTLEVAFADSKDASGYSVLDWMKRVIAEELNVKEVLEVPAISSGEVMQVSTPGVSIGLHTKLNPELVAEGTMREIVRTLQAARKRTGLQLGELVEITYSTTSPELIDILEKFNAKIAQSVGASKLAAGDGEDEEDVNGHLLRFKLHKN